MRTILKGVNSPLVITERHRSGQAGLGGPIVDLDRVQGLSIYLPLAAEEHDHDLPFYRDSQLALARDTGWNEFIFGFLDRVDPQAPAGSKSGGRGHPVRLLDAPKHVYLPLVLNTR